ncbi:hypothetical protein [Deinococcus sp. PESE-13]
MRVLWQTEAAGCTAQLRAGAGQAALVWPRGELRADTIEEVLALAAADGRLPAEVCAQLLDDLDLLAGGPPRVWTP